MRSNHDCISERTNYRISVSAILILSFNYEGEKNSRTFSGDHMVKITVIVAHGKKLNFLQASWIWNIFVETVIRNLILQMTGHVNGGGGNE